MSTIDSTVRHKSKKSQVKYHKPTQPLYRPPSARFDCNSNESIESNQSSNTSLQSYYSNESRYQPSYFTNAAIVTSNAFPIKGVLKRSKSFGNNRNSGEFNSLLEESSTGRFLLSLDGLCWKSVTLIKQALNPETCELLSMTQLMQIIRILCNKVLEKPTNAKMIAQICIEIHQKPQLKMNTLSDHKYLFLESLANCLREWFNERDQLRFTTGGARRWTGYILFVMEMYRNLKAIDYCANMQQQQKTSKMQQSQQQPQTSSNIDFQDSSEDEDVDDDDDDDGVSDDNDCSNDADSNSVDEEVSRAFSSDLVSSETEDTNSNKADGSSDCSSNQKRKSSLNIETKIMNSMLSKQQKQFCNLLLDSFQVILANPNSTPAEIECMQTAFRKCGNYLVQDNRNRTKAVVFIVRDTLLNCANASQFINASNSSKSSSITKSLLEIIELSACDWKFNQSQQIYYFPYTKME